MVFTGAVRSDFSPGDPCPRADGPGPGSDGPGLRADGPDAHADGAGARIGRRTALGGAGLIALALAGCTAQPKVAKPTASALAGDPLAPLYRETLSLITTYGRAAAATPALAGLLAPLEDDHRRHAVALAAAIGIVAPTLPPPIAAGSPATAVPPAGTGPQRATLAAAERTARNSAIAACLAAPADRAAVLGSIAACRASHVEVLA